MEFENATDAWLSTFRQSDFAEGTDISCKALASNADNELFFLKTPCRMIFRQTDVSWYSPDANHQCSATCQRTYKSSSTARAIHNTHARHPHHINYQNQRGIRFLCTGNKCCSAGKWNSFLLIGTGMSGRALLCLGVVLFCVASRGHGVCLHRLVFSVCRRVWKYCILSFRCIRPYDRPSRRVFLCLFLFLCLCWYGNSWFLYPQERRCRGNLSFP